MPTTEPDDPQAELRSILVKQAARGLGNMLATTHKIVDGAPPAVDVGVAIADMQEASITIVLRLTAGEHEVKHTGTIHVAEDKQKMVEALWRLTNEALVELLQKFPVQVKPEFQPPPPADEVS